MIKIKTSLRMSEIWVIKAHIDAEDVGLLSLYRCYRLSYVSLLWSFECRKVNWKCLLFRNAVTVCVCVCQCVWALACSYLCMCFCVFLQLMEFSSLFHVCVLLITFRSIGMVLLPPEPNLWAQWKIPGWLFNGEIDRKVDKVSTSSHLHKGSTNPEQ